ncbi:MAG: hypothetical protein JJE30_19495 [Desulfuromonadales bacterium]|nr:hypothetical protein [Desulfuromonadales bacterium]
MKQFNKMVVLLTIVSLLGATTVAFAEDNAFRDTFQSAFYGGAVGALVGAALMAFAYKPADHLDYMGYGAAVGVLAGTVYGVAKTARSLAYIENGKLKLGMPTIIPDLVESPTSRQMNVSWRTDILRGTFN